MGLNNINSKSTWGQAASDINTNFTTIDSDLKKVKNATTRNKGYFSSDTELKSAFPSANVGDIAYVGNSYPYAIWKWNGSAWANSGSTGGEESVNLGDFYTKVETDEKFTETDAKLSELGSDIPIVDKLLINPNEEIGKYIYKDGKTILTADARLHLTSPIELKQGDVISMYASTLNDTVSAISLSDFTGTPYKSVAIGLPSNAKGHFAYIAEEDCYVRISYCESAKLWKIEKSIYQQLMVNIISLNKKYDEINDVIDEPLPGDAISAKIIGNGTHQQSVLLKSSEIKEAKKLIVYTDNISLNGVADGGDYKMYLRVYDASNNRTHNGSIPQAINQKWSYSFKETDSRYEILFFAGVSYNTIEGGIYDVTARVWFDTDLAYIIPDNNSFPQLHYGIDGDSITAGGDKWSYYMLQQLGGSQHNVAVGWACWSYREKMNISNTKIIIPQKYNDADFAGFGGAEDLSTDATIQQYVNNNACTHIEKYMSEVEEGKQPIPDVFIFAMGTNADTGYGNREGAIDEAMNAPSIEDSVFYDSDGKSLKYSMCGAMRWCIETIKRAYPKCRVFVSLPIQGARYESNRTYLYPKVQLIKEMAIQMGCQIIDQYSGCGITAAIENDNSPFGPYLRDGLHPNEDGEKLMGAYAASQIKAKYFVCK